MLANRSRCDFPSFLSPTRESERRDLPALANSRDELELKSPPSTPKEEEERKGGTGTARGGGQREERDEDSRKRRTGTAWREGDRKGMERGRARVQC